MLLLLLACSHAPTTPEGRYSPQGAVDEGALWMAGGASSTASDGPLGDAWRYDLDQGTWDRRADPPAPFLRSAGVRDGAEVSFFGGSTTGFVDLDTLWRWDTEQDRWSEIQAAGPAARFKHASALAEGELLVLGGRNDDGAQEILYGDLWAFDPTTVSWREIPTSGGPWAIQRHVIAWDPDRQVLWVHGGYQPPAGDPEGGLARSDRLWSIDLEDGAWTEWSWTGDGPPARASHLLAVVGGALVVWGGNGTDTSAWSFDPEAAVWTEHPASPAPIARDGFLADLAPDGATIWLAGGDPVSTEVPNFVMDVWRLDTASWSWTELVPIDEE